MLEVCVLEILAQEISCSTYSCLSFGPSMPLLCTGLLALENLPSEAAADSAIAGALLLEHVPQAAAILLRPGALSALVDAALDEAAAPSVDTGKGAVLQDQAPLH